jgi:hypothetical protein
MTPTGPTELSLKQDTVELVGYQWLRLWRRLCWEKAPSRDGACRSKSLSEAQVDAAGSIICAGTGTMGTSGYPITARTIRW